MSSTPLRRHFAALFRDPFRCSDESIAAVFPYCVGFLVGIVTTVAVVLLLALR
jgi:hypothetical protein